MSARLALFVNSTDGGRDIHHETVFAVQTTDYAKRSNGRGYGEECGLGLENVFILAAATGGLTGSIQVSYFVEVSIFCMLQKGFLLESMISGMGICPIAPSTRDELSAMDRVNTALIFGCAAC